MTGSNPFDSFHSFYRRSLNEYVEHSEINMQNSVEQIQDEEKIENKWRWRNERWERE